MRMSCDVLLALVNGMWEHRLGGTFWIPFGNFSPGFWSIRHLRLHSWPRVFVTGSQRCTILDNILTAFTAQIRNMRLIPSD